MTNSDSLLVKLVGFDIALVEKWKNSKIKTLIFFAHLFSICRELENKIIYQKKLILPNIQAC